MKNVTQNGGTHAATNSMRHPARIEGVNGQASPVSIPAVGDFLPLELHRAVRVKEAMSITGDKKSHFYDRQNPKSAAYDPSFPRPFRLGDSTRAPTVYWLHELLGWLQSRADLSRKPAQKEAHR